MRPALSFAHLNVKLQQLTYRLAGLSAAAAALVIGINRCTLALRPEQRPSDAEFSYVREIASLNGDWMSQREMLDHLGKTKRVIAKGYRMCQEFERKGYRGQVDRLEQALLEKSQDAHDYGMAALNNLCPELKE
jgi:hypothetical protein